ncbi:MAG: hypothetical protein IH840_17470, partial [Candidatus Heimdallarchaeota archaeon]|nr:hypothetical protein [Candidatus Heimdallarchaeota archaeon]
MVVSVIFGSIIVVSSPYVIRTEVGTEMVIRAYDLGLNEIAEYRENITIGPTYERLRNEAISVYEKPKLQFLSDSPFNIIAEEKIVFENILDNSISSVNLEDFLSGFNEVTKLTDFSLDKISLNPRSKENRIFDGLSDAKFVWFGKNKQSPDPDGGLNSLEQFKNTINYSMEIFDVTSNLVTNIAINWSNFPARFSADEVNPSDFNFEVNWMGNAIRDRYQYQIFYYSQDPRDDQSSVSPISRIFVLQLDTDTASFTYYVFDFDESIDPQKLSSVVFSTDGKIIFLGPWIEGRTLVLGESDSTHFSEDQQGILIDLELNTTKLHT